MRKACRPKPRFNSTLVRLKATPFTASDYGLDEFQFHTGSIKSINYYHSKTQLIRVSIPHWFD